MQAAQDAQPAAQQSQQPASYNGPTTVKITDGSRGAVIYYSTDSWSPRVNSPRYLGPVRIDSTTTLQAIAMAPYCSAQYVIVGPPASSDTAAVSPSPTTASVPANRVAVPFVFWRNGHQNGLCRRQSPYGSLAGSETRRSRNQKGTAATVTITQVDRPGIGRAPGALSFEADDLHPASGPIPLQGGATRDGEAKLPNATVVDSGDWTTVSTSTRHGRGYHRRYSVHRLR